MIKPSAFPSSPLLLLQCPESGCDGYISKPVMIHSFLHTVRSFFSALAINTAAVSNHHTGNLAVPGLDTIRFCQVLMVPPRVRPANSPGPADQMSALPLRSGHSPAGARASLGE